MRGWFLFAVLAFLVFGVPLIDAIYRQRVRRAANRARPIMHGPISLVPEEDAQDLVRSPDVAPVAKTSPDVARVAKANEYAA
jgi:hypothetical protein